MKKAFNILLILVLTILMSSLFFDDTSLSLNLIGILYTVSGILFSVGIGLAVTFKIGEIKHPIYRKSIKDSLIKVRNSFFFYFAISTVMFVFCSENGNFFLTFNLIYFNIFLNISVLTITTIIISMLYFTTNFIAIQKLNDEIEDLSLK